MKPKLFERFDFILYTCVILLIGLGIAFIYSSGINSQGINVSDEYKKQIFWVCIGIVVSLVVGLYDYRKLARISPQLFIIGMVVLVYTMFFGKLINNSRSWIGIGSLGIQPSEITKIIFILFLAQYLERSKNEVPIKRFIISMVIMLVPMGLILLQPDLGTASVYFPICLVMCFMASFPLRYILAVLGAVFATILFIFLPIWQTTIIHKTIKIISVLTNTKLLLLIIISCLLITILGIIGQIYSKRKYYFWITYVFGILTFAFVASFFGSKVLGEYQIQRLITFIDPYSSPGNFGYNLIQSKVAIGSGNFFGRGFLQGTQSHNRFLPEQSTDFIFSILGEELGFVGGFIVYVLFFIIFLRIIYIIKQTSSVYGYYVASGILGMFFFHFIVNAGMVMGIMPITGIPHPFLSYGGSALLTNMIAIGLLLSINSRRLDFNMVA